MEGLSRIQEVTVTIIMLQIVITNLLQGKDHKIWLCLWK